MSAALERGRLLYLQDRNDLAEKEIRMALAEEPSSVEAHALLALCLKEQEKFQEALAEAGTAIHHGPDVPFAHVAMAEVRLELDQYDASIASARGALTLDPMSIPAWSILAATEIQRKNWTEALAAAESGLQIDPEHAGCANLRALALVQLGRRAEAAETMQGVLERDPEDATTHANKGWALLHEGKAKDAMMHFREALRLDPNMEWARAGIVEAMKARWWPYGLLLRFWLRLGRFGSTAQVAITIGLVVVVNVLGRVGDRNPDLKPWTDALGKAYFWFVVASWTADPVFNLLLSLNRFGRLALSRDQKRGAFVMGFLIAVAIAFALLGWTLHRIFLTYVLGVVFLMIPASAVFSRPPGRQRLIAAVIAGGLTLMGLLVVLLPWAYAVGLVSKDDASSWLGSLTYSFMLGCILSTWILGPLSRR